MITAARRKVSDSKGKSAPVSPLKNARALRSTPSTPTTTSTIANTTPPPPVDPVYSLHHETTFSASASSSLSSQLVVHVTAHKTPSRKLYSLLHITHLNVLFSSPSETSSSTSSSLQQSSHTFELSESNERLHSENPSYAIFETKHTTPITSVSILPSPLYDTQSSTSSTTIITASKDLIIAWLVPDTSNLVDITSSTLKSDPGCAIDHVTISLDAEWAACTLDDEILAIHIKTRQSIRLQGHIGRVQSIAFMEHDPSAIQDRLIVSCSEDRTFQVWSLLPTPEHLYTSPIISSSPFCTVTPDPRRFRAVISTMDALRVFEFTPLVTKSMKCEPRELKCIDIGKIWNNNSLIDSEKGKDEDLDPIESLSKRFGEEVVVNSLPSWRRRRGSNSPPTYSSVDDNDDVDTVEQSVRILSHHFLPTLPSRILIGLNAGLLIMDMNSYSFVWKFDFSNTPIPRPLTTNMNTDTTITSKYLKSSSRNNNACTLLSAFGYAFINIPDTLNPTTAILVRNDMSQRSDLIMLEQTKSQLVKQDKLTTPRSGRDVEAFVDALDVKSLTFDRLVDMVLSGMKSNTVTTTTAKTPWNQNIYKDCLMALSVTFGIKEINHLRTISEDTWNAMKVCKEIPRSVVDVLMMIQSREFGKVANNDGVDSGVSFARCVDDKCCVVGSPLKPKVAGTGATKTVKKPSSSSSSSSPMNKPVTFKSRIKSSGYGAAPAAAKWLSSSKSKSTSANKPRPTSTSPTPKTYPIDTQPIIQYAPCLESIQHNGPITSLAYSSDSKWIFTGSVDRTCRAYKVSSLFKPTSDGLAKVVAKDFIGHNTHVTHVSTCSGTLRFGNEFKYLCLTTEISGIGRLWSVDRSEPLLTLDAIQHKKCQFFHDSRFILSASLSSPECQLFSYTLVPTDSKSIKPNMNPHRYKKVCSITTPTSASITTLSGTNNALSGVIIIADSSKGLHVYDVAKNAFITSMESAFKIHHIAIPDFAYALPPPIGTSVFATMAVNDSIKLWDTRSSRPVLHFQGGHTNRFSTSLSCSLSPCGRYVASGSEDRNWFLYDVRMGLPLHRVSEGGFGDVVNTVVFDPVMAGAVAGDACGRVRFFEPKIL